MIACVQRVRRAEVSVRGEVIGAIGQGILILLGVVKGDTDEVSRWVVRKAANLRIFPDDNGKMSRSVKDIGGSVLIVSQFTLAGTCDKGNRPDFTGAMPPAEAERMYEDFVADMRSEGLAVATGSFGADMLVSLENDGPVTILIEKGA